MKKSLTIKKLMLDKQTIRELGQHASGPMADILGGLRPVEPTLGCWYSRGSGQPACCA